KEVRKAAEAANAHEFITDMPKGYDSPLGERGVKISGGERQRIAVARAFLRDSPILILDEPTSSIDSRTEAVIIEALERLMIGRTTILIAHRLSTIRNVEHILVMDHGRLLQQGTHSELLMYDGLYRQLWEAQTRAHRGQRPVPPASARRELKVAEEAADSLAGSDGRSGEAVASPARREPAGRSSAPKARRRAASSAPKAPTA